MVPRGWLPTSDWTEVDSSDVDAPGPLIRHADPYAMEPEKGKDAPPVPRRMQTAGKVIRFQDHTRPAPA